MNIEKTCERHIQRLDREHASISEDIKELANASNLEDAVADIRHKISEWELVYETYKLDILDLTGSAKKTYRKASKIQKKNLEAMKQNLEGAIAAIENAENRSSLLEGGVQSKTEQTEKGLLDYATAKESETTDIAMGLTGTLAECQEIGESALNKMNQQLELMGDIMDEMVGMRDDVKQGKKILRRFARRQASTKCFAILTFLLAASICAVLAAAIFGNGIGTNESAANSL